MSSNLGLLLGLLLLAYLGSAVSESGSRRLFGLPSGAEYLALGFVLGPVALGVIERTLVETFAPALAVGGAWLALIGGLDCGRVSRVSVALRMATGVLLTLAVGAGLALSAWVASGYLTELDEKDRLTLALGIAAVSCATTQHALRWTITGLRSRGMLSSALLDMSRASPVVPAVLLNIVRTPVANTPITELPSLYRVGISLAIGAVLGSLAALLLGREFRRGESWGVLLGVALFATGICGGLGLSGVAALFALGLTLGLLSEQRDEIRAMILPTERAVVLPVALLLGGSVNPTLHPYALALAALALITRAALEWARGVVICLSVRPARRAGPWVGLSMTSAGSFTLAACAELALNLQGTLSAIVLTVGSVMLIAGELVGPAFLRRSLLKAGDLPRLSQPPSGEMLTESES